MNAKINGLGAKILLTSVALTTITSILPNAATVFGYGSGVGDGKSDGKGNTAACGDSKPGSAPVLLSAVSLGKNQIALNWSDASDPVSYYLVTFGTKPGEQLYGNPNVGPRGTRSYTVNNVPAGKKFYFKVRAGNGCKPGDYSNEVSAVAGGLAFAGTPAGFQAGVLGAQTEATPTAAPTTIVTPTTSVVYTPTEAPKGGFLSGLIKFIRSLFGLK